MDKDKALNKAKITLISQRNSVFICTVLFSLKFSWDEETPTAKTNGLELLMNPDFFMSLSTEERVFLLAHEAWHVAFMHTTIDRRKSKSPIRWNMAGDFVINLMLKDSGYKMPQGGLIDEQYRDMSTNAVYDLLPEDTDENNPDFDSDIDDAEGSGAGADADEIEAKIEDIVVRASTQAQMQGQDPGSLPEHMRRILDKLLNPVLDWRTILQNYMTAFSKEDYSFSRPNRRFMPDHYLPGMHSESLGEIAVAIDTSGSVSPKEFAVFLTEINDIKESLRPTSTRVITFDTRIHDDIQLTADQPIDEVELHGGGGTDLRPVFKRMKDKEPIVLIIFSDLYCDEIRSDPGYPVIWIAVNHKDAKVNFGDLIHYSTTDL